MRPSLSQPGAPPHRADGHDPMAEGRPSRSEVSTFVGVRRRPSSMSHEDAESYARTMAWLRSAWDRTAPAALAPGDPARPDEVAPRTARGWAVDAAAFVVAVAIGALLLRIAAEDASNQMTSSQVALDAALGAVCCTSLWWRRRWPFGVALVCVLLGAFSTFGTVAGLFALSSLAVHRPVRPALLVAALFVPSAVVC
jgi:hypothetical protein